MTTDPNNMKKEINTLAQLQKEKEKLKLQMEVTKHAFVKGLGNSRKLVTNFALKRVALPAAAFGLTTLGVRNWLASGDDGTNGQERAAKESSKPHWLQHAIPIALTAVQTWIKLRQAENNGEY